MTVWPAPASETPPHARDGSDEDALVGRVIHTANLARASGTHPLPVARQGLQLLLDHLRSEGLSERALEPLARYITTLG